MKFLKIIVPNLVVQENKEVTKVKVRENSQFFLTHQWTQLVLYHLVLPKAVAVKVHKIVFYIIINNSLILKYICPF